MARLKPNHAPALHSTPAVAHERPVRSCKECGDTFRVGRIDQVFCCAGHRDRWHKRARERGAQAYEVLIGWRMSRGKDKKNSISELAHIVDGWIMDDKDQGRETKKSGG